jgi:TonB family protein
VRFLATLAALALTTPSWSGNLGACSNTDASAALAKIRQYILPAPDSPQHRWMVSKAGDGWRITEYSGLRVFIRCQPVSKADELNGVLNGEVEFQYEASRSTMLPELTSAGLQWSEWSKWTDFLKPLDSSQEAELPPLMLTMYRLARVADFRDRHVPIRKYQGKFQLEWEYESDSQRSALMPAADVNHFFRTADAEAAKLRIAEAEAQAEQAKRAVEKAQLLSHSQQVSDSRPMGQGARMTRAANPDDYYPPGSVRREEQGSPVVKVCVGPSGKLLREPVVTDTSGFPDLDLAAIKVAKDTRYAAGTENGTALPESCIRFKVKFTLNTY